MSKFLFSIFKAMKNDIFTGFEISSDVCQFCDNNLVCYSKNNYSYSNECRVCLVSGTSKYIVHYYGNKKHSISLVVGDFQIRLYEDKKLLNSLSELVFNLSRKDWYYKHICSIPRSFSITFKNEQSDIKKIKNFIELEKAYR